MRRSPPTLPSGPLDLLVRAALAPPDSARAAWSAWRRGYTLDETPWNEVRLLGAVAERIAWLEADAEIAPRLKGIQKFLYAQTQLCLTGCMSGLAALATAGVPSMLIKGAARVAADGRTARQRLVRDLDVLVPFARRTDGFVALATSGWSFKANGRWQAFWHALDATANHHAWSLEKDTGEIDLHHFSNSLNRFPTDDDGLWARAVRIAWRGLDIHVPGPSDALVLGIVHGLRWSRESNADWIIDVASGLDTGGVDWDVVLEEARRRKVQAILLTGLDYLRDAIGRDVPRGVTDRLAAEANEMQWAELATYAVVPTPREPAQSLQLLDMAIARASDGPAGHPPGPRGLLRMTADALPFRSRVALPRAALETDVTQLTVRLSAVSQPQAQLDATLCIFGLVLDAASGVPTSGGSQGASQDFNFTIPTRLLRRRGTSQICFTVAPASNPAYPPWRYHFPAPGG